MRFGFRVLYDAIMRFSQDEACLLSLVSSRTR